MKNCLIIAHARSGSTNLMKSIASANNIKHCFEPFGNKVGNLEGDKCVKVLVFRKTNEFFINFSKSYDKVVVLARKNTELAAESLAKLWSVGAIDNAYNIPWVSLTESEKLKVPEYIEYLNKEKADLEIISKALGIPIDYYEDVYSNKTLLDTSIKLDTSYLKSFRKLRKTKHNIL